jgi:hypothetical protein
MTRVVALLLGVLAAAAVTSASAKEPVPQQASAVLAMLGEDSGQGTLVWLNARTLRQLSRGSVPLGGATGTVYSPTGGRIAAGSAGLGIRIVDVFRMKQLSRIARRSMWEITPIAWPLNRRLLALEFHQRLPQRNLVVIDPVARKVLRRIPLDLSFPTWRSVGADTILLAQPEGTIGSAQLFVVSPNGELRSVVLDRIAAGGVQEGAADEPDFGVADPGLAVDATARRAYVIGKEPVLAEIDLASLAVTYRALRETKRTPSRREKSLLGWSRQAEWLGDGRLAVTGADFQRLQSTPAGLTLVDVSDGSSAVVDSGASFSLKAADRVIAAGAWTDGADTWSGMGVAAYARDGARIWHVLGGEPVSWLQSAAGYAYVPGPDTAPSTTRVVDLRTGAVRTVRQAIPFFVTP